MPYTAPIADMRFALEACADFWSLRPRYQDLDEDTLIAILEGAGSLAEETLAPLNRSGDRAGVSLKDGNVTAAPGFQEAYNAFKQGGWQGLAADPAYGGQGLPRALALAVMETVHSANMSFGLLPMLTLGAIEAIEQHGAADQKLLYLEKLISGEWSGTMNLTEPQAGSDLGVLTTKAVPQADGSYAITGQKIFITWGEHDLADNIIHLVLARIESAPAGSKGISLFIVPKFRDEDGSRNAVRCIGLEEKMGIHASPTCTMAYDGATGWLIGAENRGLAAMFTMMNAARLNVGMEGVSVAEAAYQKALSYAKERRQGGALIIDHPDVRRMLMTMKAKIQAGRAICYATAVAADSGNKRVEDLLTPIAKAWGTDVGVEVTSLGVQIHGGMGFVEEGGAAQFYRDARIAPIYEGTNGIQAIDLYGRKLLGDRGEAMGHFIDEAHKHGGVFAKPSDALKEATHYMLTASRDDALAGATAYLALAGEVIGGLLLARGVHRAHDPERKKLFDFYAATVLARAPSRLAEVKVGAGALKLGEFA
ncbi:acyl-CoA dehydrogenase [Candidatus Viadribacter manganicus]|uniref:3-methylmercaptopropionyl-CoA dehydrogenase n=1 Tax=Candidatus Viadribacter manganicus TaxID=1759059 RepID=A0A1B1AEL4_9PROT|nr:acyl-CoA dehydrogenase [Candidatus Viadribacter manganicus]ANP44997.1 acyl-CoA dehydrogenase [Candidatus Viadribacter manganicus]